jgi:hypothetical protein
MTTTLFPLLQSAGRNVEGRCKLRLRQAAFQPSLDDIIGFDLIFGSELAALDVTDSLQQFISDVTARVTSRDSLFTSHN